MENDNHNQPVIKINLNASAILAIMGDDPQIRLDLQRAVIENFARRHIITMDKDPDIQAVLSQVARTKSEMVQSIRKTAEDNIRDANRLIMEEMTGLIE